MVLWDSSDSRDTTSIDMITIDVLVHLMLQVGGGTYYMSHRREFLDVAGEWHLDEAKNELLLAVPVGTKPPSSLVAPAVKQIFVLEGTQSNPVRGVQISELTFRHVAPTFMEDYAVGSGGDYSVYRDRRHRPPEWYPQLHRRPLALRRRRGERDLADRLQPPRRGRRQRNAAHWRERGWNAGID